MSQTTDPVQYVRITAHSQTTHMTSEPSDTDRPIQQSDNKPQRRVLTNWSSSSIVNHSMGPGEIQCSVEYRKGTLTDKESFCEPLMVNG